MGSYLLPTNYGAFTGMYMDWIAQQAWIPLEKWLAPIARSHLCYWLAHDICCHRTDWHAPTFWLEEHSHN